MSYFLKQTKNIRDGVKFTKEAVTEINRLTKGYPYFIQEWGYQSWNYAGQAHIVQMISRQSWA